MTAKRGIFTESRTASLVPDIIAPALTILFIGYNPGMRSAATGHHFAGHSNRFWKLLADAELTPRRYAADEDSTLTALGFGITNIVARPTPAAADLRPEEFAAGREVLRGKLERYRPRVACFVGIGVYREFRAVRTAVLGPQAGSLVPGVAEFAVPNPSGLNRMPYDQQLGWYRELKKFATG